MPGVIVIDGNTLELELEASGGMRVFLMSAGRANPEIGVLKPLGDSYEVDTVTRSASDDDRLLLQKLVQHFSANVRFIATLSVDGKTTTRPSMSETKREIGRLDGVTRTMLTLAPPDPKGPPRGDHHLVIGGGADDKLIVYFTEDNLKFFNLREPRRAHLNQKVMMAIGEQEGEYTESQFVSRETAVKAARYYLRYGKLAPDLLWLEE